MVLAAAANHVPLRADIDVAAGGGRQVQRAGVGAEVGEGRRSCTGIAVVAGRTAAAAVVHVACSSSAFVVVVEEGVVETLAVLDNTAEGGGDDDEGVVVVEEEPDILIGEDIGAFPQVEGYSAEFAAAV